MIYKKNIETMLSQVEDYFVLVKATEIFKINEISARIFDLIDGEKTVEEITDKLKDFYQKYDEQITNEILAFIENLENEGLVERV